MQQSRLYLREKALKESLSSDIQKQSTKDMYRVHSQKQIIRNKKNECKLHPDKKAH
jgi:hypothetical protein